MHRSLPILLYWLLLFNKGEIKMPDKKDFDQLSKVVKEHINKKRLTIVEIQYLRGLITMDRIENKYEEEGRNALIDRNTTMDEFTKTILNKLDELEDL
jgi:hypothetical protein